MHSLEEGFSITVYNCTHCNPLLNHIHCNCGICFDSAERFFLLWHDQCLHSGARSQARSSGVYQDNSRLTSCVRTAGSIYLTSRSLARGQKQDGTQVYRLNELHCEFFKIRKNKITHCIQCLDGLFVLDLSDYLPSFYNPRDRILRDLKRLGWLLLRGVIIDKET